jgi:hypothetical protein
LLRFTKKKKRIKEKEKENKEIFHVKREIKREKTELSVKREFVEALVILQFYCLS